MKSATTVLLLSTLVNVSVLTTFALRPTLAPAAFRDAFHLGEHTPAPLATAPKAPAPPATKHQLWSDLGTTDLPTLIARLRAAGLSGDLIREIVRAEINSRYDARLRSFTEPDPSKPYWKSSGANLWNSARSEEYYALIRERSRLLRDLLGDPSLADAEITDSQRRQFGSLSRQKIDLLQRITDDYADMFAAATSATGGITLPEDRAKLALLTKEKNADLAAVLTPEELAEYKIRSSPITNLMSRQLGDFHASEAEYHAIFDAQQALNDLRTSVSATNIVLSSNSDRTSAQQDIDAQLRARLGDARYADYIRETSPDYNQLRALVDAAQLPVDVGIRAFNLRDSVSAESIRIVDDATMSDDQKRTALAALAQGTRDQLLALLGSTAGPAYIKILERTWLTYLGRGSSFNLAGGGSAFIVSGDNGATYISLGSSARPLRNVPIATPAPRL